LIKTLETFPGNITKLLNITKTNFAPPPPPPKFNVVENAETTFGKIAGQCNIELLEVGA
jgi:hypothetical protein